MDLPRDLHAAAERTVAWVVAGIGTASFGVLILATRRLASLERAFDAGDFTVLGVFAAFGSLCLAVAWRVLRHPPQPGGSVPTASPSNAPAAPARVTVSQGCAAAGVVLLILSVLVPEHWYPVVLLFLGLALLALSHALTPCVERMEQLRRARDSMRQL